MREEIGRGLQSSRLAIIGWRTVYSNKGSKWPGLRSSCHVLPLLFPYQLNLVEAAVMRKWRCKGCGIAKHIKAILCFYLWDFFLGIFIRSITFLRYLYSRSLLFRTLALFVIYALYVIHVLLYQQRHHWFPFLFNKINACVCTGFGVSFEMIHQIKIWIIVLHSTPIDLIRIQTTSDGYRYRKIER